jgi:hypothetical protein
LRTTDLGNHEVKPHCSHPEPPESHLKGPLGDPLLICWAWERTSHLKMYFREKRVRGTLTWETLREGGSPLMWVYGKWTLLL